MSEGEVGSNILSDWLSVSAAAQVTGISAHTLRYYERAGLLQTPRTAAGQRRYCPGEVLALEFISRPPRAGDHDLAQRQAHLEAIDRKITAYRDGAPTTKERP